MILNFFESIHQKNLPSGTNEDDLKAADTEPVLDGESAALHSKSIRIAAMPPGILAYMGDSIFELIIRNYFVQRQLWDSHKIHRHVIRFVNAGAQAALLRHLEPRLTEEERNVMRRARNSNAGNVPRNAKVSDYRYSTAFEAVIGYTLLQGDIKRLGELTEWIEEYLDQHISGR